MLKKTTLTLALALATSAFATDYTIDAGHTNARFSIDHFGTSTNHGGFYNLTGEIKFDPKAKTGFVDVTIPVAEHLNTARDAFTAHLKTSDLLDADKYPTMRFISDKWHFNEGKVTSVEGKLTMMGKTHPVTLTATKFNCYQNPLYNAEVCGGDFTTTIDRTQWGINYLIEAGIPKEVKLDIQIEAVKK